MDNLYALIMAGGGGTRLWPLSRQQRPKQVLALTEERSMFEVAVERLEPMLPPDRIFVVTGRQHVEQLRSMTPQIPAENFVIEPFGQDTGPAVGLGTMHIRHRDPNAIIAVLTADQHIANTAKFRRVLNAAATLTNENYIVTLGISPSYPSTGFGYIKRGDALKEVDGFQAFHAAEFTEKPDQRTAIQFITTGLYTWNSGMFIWQANQVIGEFRRQQPEMCDILEEIGTTIGTPNYTATLDRLWPTIKRISIDYAVMENAPNLAVFPIDIGWSDVGSWATLFEVLDGDLNGNVSRGNNEHIKFDTRDTLIVSDRMVVTIGIENIVIVDTDDVVLVCDRDRSQDVRKIVNMLKDTGLEEHL